MSNILKKSHICEQHLILVMVLKSKIADALTLLFFLFKIIVNVKTESDWALITQSEEKLFFYCFDTNDIGITF